MNLEVIGVGLASTTTHTLSLIIATAYITFKGDVVK
jgi:hypothetical protein